MLPVSLVLRTLVTWVDLKDRIGVRLPVYCMRFLTLVSDHSLEVVHEVKRRYPIFQTPHSNGGQHLGALVACPFLPLHK